MKKLIKKYQDGKCGFVDEEGNWQVEPRYKEEDIFEDNIALIWDYENSKWGFVDIEGNYIEPQYDSVNRFSNGLAVVKINGKYGYIDKTGEYQIEPKFDSADNFNDDIAWVYLNNKFGLINKSGNFIVEPMFDEKKDFNNGIAKIKWNGKWGFINSNGEFVIKAKYESINDFESNITYAKLNNKWGWVDIKDTWYNKKPVDIKYNIGELKKTIKSKKIANFIFFKDVFDEQDTSYLSQWYPSDFIIEGQRYNFIGQFISAQKALLFQDKESFKKIVNEKNPSNIILLDQKIKNVDETQWYRDKKTIIREAIFAKFTQNEKLKQYLISLKDKILINENSFDKFMGIEIGSPIKELSDSSNWKGENILGFILMDVRDEIIERIPELERIEWEEEMVNEVTGDLEMVNRSCSNEKYLPSSKELWEKLLKEEAWRIEYEKPISERLKKYLHEHHDAVPIIKDIDTLTQGDLEDLLGAKDYTNEHSHFSVYPPEYYDDNKWRASYGWNHQCYDSKPYDTYSEALENGAIEFIDSFCNDRDEEGNLYLYID